MVGHIKEFIILFFCSHDNWSNGNRINKKSRFGLVEFICLDCGKTIYREPGNPPINKG